MSGDWRADSSGLMDIVYDIPAEDMTDSVWGLDCYPAGTTTMAVRVFYYCDDSTSLSMAQDTATLNHVKASASTTDTCD